MRTGIEQARLDLAKWEARVAEDGTALAEAEHQAALIRDRLTTSTKAANSLRGAVQRWDAMQARHEPRRPDGSNAPGDCDGGNHKSAAHAAR